MDGTATIEGSCWRNGAPCTFRRIVPDHRHLGAADTLTIAGQGITPASGTLTSGDLVVRG